MRVVSKDKLHRDHWLYILWGVLLGSLTILWFISTPLVFCYILELSKAAITCLDVISFIFFFSDTFLQLFFDYTDRRSYSQIACCYVMYVLIELPACVPWAIISMRFGSESWIRYLLWTRLLRIRNIANFCQLLENQLWINFKCFKMLQFLAFSMYWVHLGACLFKYYIRGEVEYNYIESVYFATVTSSTVGYGDIVPKKKGSVAFVVIFIFISVYFTTYWTSGISELISAFTVQKPWSHRYRDTREYMKRKGVARELQQEIECHLRSQYQNSVDAVLFESLSPFARNTREFKWQNPLMMGCCGISPRSTLLQGVYKKDIQDVLLFKGCTQGFLKFLAPRVREEVFLPGEIIVEQNTNVDHFYIICEGFLDEVRARDSDGHVELVTNLQPNNIFGEIAIILTIPQPYTVLVRQPGPCRILSIDKKSFLSSLDMYFKDRKTILENLLEGTKNHARLKLMENCIKHHCCSISQVKTGLISTLKTVSCEDDYAIDELNSESFDADSLYERDYDGNTPLHIAVSRGFSRIARALVCNGAEINAKGDESIIGSIFNSQFI